MLRFGGTRAEEHCHLAPILAPVPPSPPVPGFPVFRVLGPLLANPRPLLRPFSSSFAFLSSFTFSIFLFVVHVVFWFCGMDWKDAFSDLFLLRKWWSFADSKVDNRNK